MKRLLNLFILSALIILLSSCGKFSSQENLSLNVLPQSSETIDFETTEQLFVNAMKVYGWFEMVPLQVNYDDKKQMDGKDWFKIKDENYDTHEKLDSYLKTIFASEIVDKLWAKGIYKEIDGYLYSFDSGRGRNIFIKDVKYDVKDITENKITYVATITYYQESGESENPKILEFIREKINDNWLFTQFPFFW